MLKMLPISLVSKSHALYLLVFNSYQLVSSTRIILQHHRPSTNIIRTILHSERNLRERVNCTRNLL